MTPDVAVRRPSAAADSPTGDAASRRSGARGRMLVCAYEDRASDVIGLKLLVASLLRHSPGLDIEITIPDAPAETRAWFEARPRVRVRTDIEGRPGWNVKPTLLTRALAEGAEQAIWIDSDIIVNSDIRAIMDRAPPTAIVFAEDVFGAPRAGGTARTAGLGLAVGRRMRATANTAVVRVTGAHLELLDAWHELLEREDYLAAQRRPFQERPLWFIGDQELLTGLLGSTRFSDIPIVWLRAGPEVAHCFPPPGGMGYAAHQRVANVLRARTPMFVHSCCDKPWRPPGGAPTLHFETSPYTLLAADYERDLGESLPWTRPTLWTARLLRAVSRDGPTATGLLPAVWREITDQRALKVIVKRALGWE